jgi:hypothetical protein
MSWTSSPWAASAGWPVGAADGAQAAVGLDLGDLVAKAHAARIVGRQVGQQGLPVGQTALDVAVGDPGQAQVIAGADVVGDRA